VDALHYDMILAHGGLPGLRDEPALESALARPRQRWAYDEASDIGSLAAAYAFGIARNHPFQDGNKRTAFLAMTVFAELNGLSLEASETEVVQVMVGLAAGDLTEEELASWLRENLVPASNRPPG
jgi:death-on-curing protein